MYAHVVTKRQNCLFRLSEYISCCNEACTANRKQETVNKLWLFLLMNCFDVPCLGSLAEALNGNDIDGLYFDIVCQLLEAIFRMQEFEETETSEDDGKQLLG